MTGLATVERDLQRALDPVELAGDVSMVCDPWQVDALRSESRRQLWNCSRQVGKSTTAAVKAVHVAAYVPESLVLLVSPSQRQSTELMVKVRAVLRKLGRAVVLEQAAATTVTLENGSRIVSLPGSEATIRGYSGVNLLLLDEASRIPDDLHEATAPMVAVSGGTTIAMSTPFGMRGWWSKLWHEGGEGWERVEIPATACPRIPRSFLAEQRGQLGPWFFEQEYECAFRDSVEQLFSSELVASMFDVGIESLRLGKVAP